MYKNVILFIACFSLALPANAEFNAKVENSYFLFHRDVLLVTVFDEPDLESTIPVNAQGAIRLPMIGSVNVSEMTIYDAERRIEKAYVDGEFLSNPQVTIVVKEYTPRVVSVLGKVNDPGKFELPKQTAYINIVEIIGQAGGFQGIALSSDVKVTRQLAGGKERVFVVDVKKMIEGKEKSKTEVKQFLVYPGDVVFVPERFF